MSNPLTKAFIEVVKKYLDGKASEDEIAMLENYYQQFSNNPDVLAELGEQEVEVLRDQLKGRVYQRIKELENPTIPIYKSKFLRVAAILIITSLVALLYFSNNRAEKLSNQKLAQHDLLPGGNKAILTLADGKKISLTDAKNGTLAHQDELNINKTQDGQLVYDVNNHSSITPQTITYNIIETPRGGQYHLTLADGTQVWLNAASSLRYPTTFTGKERKVELTGEAYFEVIHNNKMPFKVIANGQEIEDIGTHFNVNAYTDELVTKTTLLEGAVKVSQNKNSKFLTPGQQVSINTSGTFNISEPDLDEVVAWKNGMFQFNDVDIESVMRQIARWYNVDVSFEGTIPTYTVHGKISRNSNASQVLKILELGGINFKIEGRKIILKG